MNVATPMLQITPTHQLQLGLAASDVGTFSKASLKRLQTALAAGPPVALVHLATDLLEATLPPSLAWARDFGRQALTAICQAAAASASPLSVDAPPPEADALDRLLQHAPPLLGIEYLTRDTLREWWIALVQHVQTSAGKVGALAWLESRHPAWRSVGRVTFHLAENKSSESHPFAFLATWVDGLTSQGAVRHVPLSSAIETSAKADARAQLLALLTPIQRAAEQLPWLQDLVDQNGLFRPQAWTIAQAHEFLRSVEKLQAAGLSVRTPDWWRNKRTARPRVNVSVGNAAGAAIGLDAMLDFSVSVALDGKDLTAQELASLLEGSANDEAGLVRLGGRWVELDRQRLQDVLTHWRTLERQASDGVSFAQAMRWMAGAESLAGPLAGPLADHTAADALDTRWVGIEPGPGLADTLAQLRNPERLQAVRTPGLKAQLRAYQSAGVSWLRFMTSLQLGACLADDMGLGKTMQIIGLLLHIRSEGARANRKTRASPPSLLIVPASLIANWRSEIDRFAPSLQAITLHPSSSDVDQRNDKAIRTAMAGADLVITTYGMVGRLNLLHAAHWNLLILDEAQAIKNAGARQTQAIKKLNANTRLALTGTPVENNLSDLWSLFDFLNPGLLGNATAFKRFMKKIGAQEQPDYSPLRTLVGPYILRRLKTDKRIIDDLPDKTEVRQFCGLSKTQARLYQTSVSELTRQLRTVEGMQRRGLVLAYLMRFKQICNHPAQWQGTADFGREHSAKFQRLAELCDELAQRQERVLVFTQFREMTEPLAALLSGVFGRSGLVLHGGTPVKRRQAMVQDFQSPDGPPFFVLSLKAGGTGLNLTAASHVVHFDRWWNPAVENQATDRAFRLGQKRNVLVHKFVCRGTVEERIDEMISAKRALADAVLDADGGRLLTEMTDTELLRFVALDIDKASEA